MNKICKQCKIEKDVSEFGSYHDNRYYKVYYKSQCKLCRNKGSRNSYITNKNIKKREPQKTKKNSRKYYLKNRESILLEKMEYNNKNKEAHKIKRKSYYDNNKSKIIKNNSEYKKNNRDNVNKRNRDRQKTDPIFKLRETIRSQIKKALNGNKRGSSINNYLNYSIIELKQYIESLFSHPDNLDHEGKVWMNWKNKAVYAPEKWKEQDSSTWVWHLDHIIPQSDLPFESMEDDNFKKCWELSNLRPYRADKNISEGPARTRHRK